eukprot:EG_transcript_13499
MVRVEAVEATAATLPGLLLSPAPLLLLCASECNADACATMQATLLRCAADAETVDCPGPLLVGTLQVDAAPAVAQQLNLCHFPTTFAVYHQQFLDSLPGNRPPSEVESFIRRFLAFAADHPTQDTPACTILPTNPSPQSMPPLQTAALNRGAVSVASPPSIPVDVQKLMTHARGLLKKGMGMTQYAAKFYSKALATLETLQAELQATATERELCAVRQALSSCHAGLANCAMAADDASGAAQYVATLRAEFADCLLPETEAQQSVSMHDTLQALGLPGLPQDKRIDQLKAELQQAPRDYPQRAQLAVLLFAEARVEECITEWIKLCTVAADWRGGAAHTCLTATLAYVGPDHLLAIKARELLGTLQGAGPHH